MNRINELTDRARAALGKQGIYRHWAVYARQYPERVFRAEPCAPPSRFVGDPVLLKEIELVLSEAQFDVILFNNGMHGWQHTEAEYQNALPKLIKAIQAQAPKARLIWATSTPLRDGKGVTSDTQS